MNIINRANW